MFDSCDSELGKALAKGCRDYATGLRYIPWEETKRCMELGHALRYYEKVKQEN